MDWQKLFVFFSCISFCFSCLWPTSDFLAWHCLLSNHVMADNSNVVIHIIVMADLSKAIWNPALLTTKNIPPLPHHNQTWQGGDLPWRAPYDKAKLYFLSRDLAKLREKLKTSPLPECFWSPDVIGWCFTLRGYYP